MDIFKFKPHFFAHFVQKGEGCEYSIGCGELLVILSAKTLPEARIEVGRQLGNLGIDDPDSEITMEKVTIYPLTEQFEEFDLKTWLSQSTLHREAEDRELAEGLSEVEERALLTKLKKKYDAIEEK